MNIPDASTFHSYEQLGIVGILLLVLLFGIAIFHWFARKAIFVAKEFVGALGRMSDAYLTTSKETVSVLASLSGNQDQLIAIVTEHHRRIDDLLSCPAQECPAKPRKMTENSFLKMSQQTIP